MLSPLHIDERFDMNFAQTEMIERCVRSSYCIYVPKVHQSVVSYCGDTLRRHELFDRCPTQ